MTPTLLKITVLTSTGYTRFRFPASIYTALSHTFFLTNLVSLAIVFSLLGLGFCDFSLQILTQRSSMAEQEVQNGGAEKVAAAAEVLFSAVKPQLFVEAPKANDAVSFYKAAFGAEEVNRTFHPKRKAEQDVPLILSAELKLGAYSFLVSDLDSDAPKTGENSVVVCLETKSVDAAIAKAVSAGAVVDGDVVEGEGACCGGRVGKVKDPFGFVWQICSPANKCGETNA